MATVERLLTPVVLMLKCQIQETVELMTYFQQGTSTPNHTFTIAEEIKYARRYEEGYNLPDARYEM